MKRKFISLRIAVILPLIIVLATTFIISIVNYSRDYNFLANDQGTKIVEVLTNNTQNELNAILTQPLIMADIIGYTISNEKMFENKDLSNIENYLKRLMTTLKQKIPQISVISYGDENGDFVGIRDNGEDTAFSLMLKDSRTNGMLNIYEGNTMNTKLISFFEDYDPRIRPWYSPVRKNIASSWSSIYINQDEKMEATISVSVPVFGVKGEFKGVFEIDVKLNGINEFLRKNKFKQSSTVFIINDKNEMVAHSENLNNLIIKNPDTEERQFIKIEESKNELIKSSAEIINDKDIKYSEINRVKLNNKNNYIMVSKLENPKGLKWKIVVIIPEADLMGSIKTRYNINIAILSAIILIGALFGTWILKRVTTPILMVAKAANEIVSRNWDVEIKEDKNIIKEAHEMIKGFNLMVDDVKIYIKKLVEKQKEIEDIHLTETVRMSEIIEEKTSNLKIVMKELMEKEKLASLGELVSGVSHEINTPLGVALSAASLMQDNNKKFQTELMQGNLTKSGLLEYMNMIEESTFILNSNLFRAAELVKSFKEIAVNQEIEEKTKFNLKEYLFSILLSLKHEYKNRNIELEVVCPEDLWIYNYSGAVSQIFTNLIMNSLIHGFKGGKSGIISIKIHEIDNILRIEYSDTGIGMNEDVKKHIFEPFYTTNRGNGGSGLGLNIVYNLVTGKMDGKISCISEIEEGTTFIMEFKL